MKYSEIKKIGNEACELWRKAKENEKLVVSLKKQNHSELCELYHVIKEKHFSYLKKACIRGKYSDEIKAEVGKRVEKIKKLEDEAKESRVKSDKLYEEMRAADTRIHLDPVKDHIPAGEHRKLKQCKKYPKREGCNYGENSEAKWDRCEFMKHKDGLNPRWVCTN